MPHTVSGLDNSSFQKHDLPALEYSPSQDYGGYVVTFVGFIVLIVVMIWKNALDGGERNSDTL